MRLLGLLLALGMAWASPLEEARTLYQKGEMAGVLARLDPLLKGHDPPEEALLPGAPPLAFTWPTWEEPAFASRLKPLCFRLREVWRGVP
ncbi:hypothetical protein [Thermus sp. NEB1569]|uniref:hypothetical protein n=1 Tax=Thermus sp. NEB1569 TaxID=2918899 RepID=UPI001EFAA939|nr:hypothetical protein [Thermus sp. NEB1569]ULR41637.1 hypothetical protein MI302_05070 [Thermus sp. NEB1569]